MLFVHEIEICAKDRCIVIGRDLFEKALEIRREMIRRGDLRTRWWMRFLGSVFNPVTQNNWVWFSFKDVNNNSVSGAVKFAVYTTPLSIFNTAYCNNRFWIAVGNGTTSPTIDDYKLAGLLAENLASYTFDDTNGVVILSSVFSFNSDTQITEVGLEWEADLNSRGACGKFLIDRTLLSSPFTAPAGTPISVAYRILV